MIYFIIEIELQYHGLSVIPRYSLYGHCEALTVSLMVSQSLCWLRALCLGLVTLNAALFREQLTLSPQEDPP